MFNFILWIAVIAIGFVIIIWYVLKWFGTMTLNDDYVIEIDKLKCSLDHWDVTPENYQEFENTFSRLRTYACRNDEEIDILENQFLKKFHQSTKK